MFYDQEIRLDDLTGSFWPKIYENNPIVGGKCSPYFADGEMFSTQATEKVTIRAGFMTPSLMLRPLDHICHSQKI